MAVAESLRQRRGFSGVAQRRGLTTRGLWARVGVSLGLVAIILIIPQLVPDFRADQITKGVIYAVIALSMNVLLGHAGQISLGHQAFVGLGAFVSGFVVTEIGLSFYLALIVSALFGAISALVLGLAALRIRGLYLALITLAYGAVAEESLFGIRTLTRGGEGMPAPRPATFQSDKAYLYLCIIVLALVILMDWRLMKTKAGRAIVAIRHDERVAATMGVNVTFYKIFAFMLSGFIAGLAGSLFAHWIQVVVANDFVFDIALIWVFMTVVGGLESKAGIVIGGMFFALFPFLLEGLPFSVQVREALPRFVPLAGAFLLIITLTLYPGGIGQQLLPIRRWLAGGPFHDPSHGKRKKAGKPKEPKKAHAKKAKKTKEPAAIGMDAGATPASDGSGATPEAADETGPDAAAALDLPPAPDESITAMGADGAQITAELPSPPGLGEGNGDVGEAPSPATATDGQGAKPKRKRTPAKSTAAKTTGRKRTAAKSATKKRTPAKPTTRKRKT